MAKIKRNPAAENIALQIIKEYQPEKLGVKVYLDFDNKEYSIATFNDKDRIFKVYCSSIYNLIKAIKDDKQYFDKSHKSLVHRAVHKGIRILKGYRM